MGLKTLVEDGLPHVFPGHRKIALYRRMFQFYRELRGAPGRVYRR